MRRLGVLVAGAIACSFSTDVEGTNGSLGSNGSTGEEGSSSTSPSSSSSSASGGPSTSVGTTASSTDADTSTTASVDPTLDTTGSSAETTFATTTSGSSGSTAAAAATCDEIYGTAPGYIPCMENETECWFNADTNGTCDAMCELFGGICLDAHDNPNDAGQECEMTGVDTDTCETVRGTELCVCSRP